MLQEGQQQVERLRGNKTWFILQETGIQFLLDGALATETSVRRWLLQQSRQD